MPQDELSARNQPTEPPLGEEEIHRRRRETRSRPSKAHATRYRDALGIQLGTPTLLHRPAWGTRSHLGFKYEGRGWQAADRPASLGTIASALGGSFGVDLREQERVRFLVIDFDAGHDLPEIKHTSLSAALDAIEKRGRGDDKRRMRVHVAAAVRPVLDKLQQVVPGATFAVIASPRGAHALMLLDQPLDVTEVRQLGQRLLAAVGSPAKVEVFPKVEASGGRTCRLPLTGSASRLLGDDLEHERHRSRMADLEAILALPRYPVAQLRSSLPAPTTSPPAAAPVVAPRAAATRRKVQPPTRADLAGRLSVQLSGDDFEQAIVEAYRQGIPDDCSWPMARKLAFLVTAMGLPKATAERFARKFFELPHHRATRCATEGGRRQLMAEFRSCLKWQQQGVNAGRVEAGKLSRPALHQMVAEVLGGRPRLRAKKTLTPATRQALSDAARKRWATRASLA